MMRKLILGVACGLLTVSLAAPMLSAAVPQSNLPGSWDGITQTAPLNGPYEDPGQSDVPFGAGSFYKLPWRSYVDTQEASQFLDSLGVVMNVKEKEIDATAQALAEVGIKHARFEMGWGNVQYDDETKVAYPVKEQEYANTLKSLQKHGIRPLILLNSNSGIPAPYKEVKTALLEPAVTGATYLKLDPAQLTGIVVKYTGVREINNQGHALSQGFNPLITELNPTTGIAKLSSPLQGATIPAGAYSLYKLKYQPLSGKTFADGTPNPASEETIEGWKTYVKSVSAFAKRALGTEGKADAGFDFEVWNEQTFGHHFMDIKYYYEPDLQFSQPPTYITRKGEAVTGQEVFLPVTTDVVSDPVNQTPGVKVISGFSNQRPKDNFRWIFDGQAGISRHYYTGYDKNKFTYKPPTWHRTANQTADALGNLGSTFVPSFMQANPEYTYTALVTEHLSRDIQPFPNNYKDHYRFANFNRKNVEMWQTETNFGTQSFTNELAAANGVPGDAPALGAIRQRIATKSTLRNYVFQSHKGLERLYTYVARENHDVTSAVLPVAFYDELAKNNFVLNDTVRAKIGPQLTAVKNTVNLLKGGEKIDNLRKLNVAEVIEHKPRLVFKGDGTPNHPDYYNREDLVIAPFQLKPNKFAIGYYVASRNLTQAWDLTKGALDPARYDFPDQTFEVTLKNINTVSPQVSAYDPVTNTSIPVTVTGTTADSIKVKLTTSDYPRFLIIEESAPGPQVKNVTVNKVNNGGLLSFVPNFTGAVNVSWGKYPARAGSKFKREYFKLEHQKGTPTIDYIDLLDYNDKGGLFPEDKPGSVRITGKIKPKYTETYTFQLLTYDQKGSVWLNDQQIIVPYGKYSASVPLVAGTEYNIRYETTSPYVGLKTASLNWYSASQVYEPVVTSEGPDNQSVIQVVKDQPVSYSIPGLREGDGVKLTYKTGAPNKYPQWNYDYTGVLWPAASPGTNTLTGPVNSTAEAVTQLSNIHVKLPELESNENLIQP
ncbi:PA14 domain-containing protein [Paenibacillus sp. FJAT-26967]|uniref:PA14 domain-containing protein n=1 Tax=Paenibacillus sp. FJAT-26967 TaxID=1729690 RepID=UPI00083837C9|nr:PA14 domain-containing protein [Paenibacillus sp. FJAT-26967]